MMFFLKLMILALIGGFIGWITNLIAIRLLFRPLKPVKLLFGMKLQGVLPSRKKELGVSIGSIIENNLLKPEEILGSLVQDEDIEHLKESIVTNVVKILKDKLPAFLHGFTDKTIKKQLEAFMAKDGDRYIHDMISNMITHATQNLSVSTMVAEKIEALDLVSFEKMVLSVVNRELRFIEYLGAVLGFFIGIIQGLVFLVI
ncbi:MAG: DUF445 family protein [Clostridiaceae bacterium]|nr:DUF445 family protein [Clostridiaceae bacterium]